MAAMIWKSSPPLLLCLLTAWDEDRHHHRDRVGQRQFVQVVSLVECARACTRVRIEVDLCTKQRPIVGRPNLQPAGASRWDEGVERRPSAWEAIRQDCSVLTEAQVR